MKVIREVYRNRLRRSSICGSGGVCEAFED